MNELEFRGWNLKTNKMHSFSSLRAFSVFALCDGLKPEDFLILPLKDSMILMQYVGIVDKNTVKVHEKDIVNISFKDKPDILLQYEISFDWRGITLHGNGEVHALEKFALSSIEVIGNIYENSELLIE